MPKTRPTASGGRLPWFVEPNAISVTVEGGAVRLSGTVHSPHERNLAATTAWSAPGTITVDNNITVS
ncbi:MAG: hypothetical protein B7Z58_16120 [Acidiphilium sp. 37-64-53]|uniref:BON domain-containing protein n=1 Tax=unclassified Acidiphilium TaxID=2617493 RepID=UPI000BCF1A83|nr:MAG: hypothetical protein B7Z58_16120 [Acidiphilium sp. 37-64-53]OZB24470.1 MAG: hypothetical protein B7X49_14715 [Acidiphilium sp. 34-64-41]